MIKEYGKDSGLILGAFGLGAGLVYFFNPRLGAYRRAQVRDKLAACTHVSGDAFDKGMRDLKNRTYGTMAEAGSIFRAHDDSDEVVLARVRSVMGRYVSHPRTIDVKVRDGRATLSGPVLAEEVDGLLSAVWKVRGVSEIINQLDAHKTRDIAALQGGTPPAGLNWDLMQENWAPATRWIMGTLGGVLMGECLRRREPLWVALGTLGFGLFTRAISNLPARRLVGAGSGRRAIDLQKTININAPVEKVFAIWSHYENFPKFMSHVREVRDHGDGRSHWVVDGPMGKMVEWEAVITQLVPNELLAWKTENGPGVQHAGIVHFQPNEHGGTRVQVQMSYNPTGGAFGHALAWLLGRDPQQQMTDDLVRFKSLIETGKATAHSRPVKLQEVEVGAPPMM